MPARQRHPPGRAQAPARYVAGLNRRLCYAFSARSLRSERLDSDAGRDPGEKCGLYQRSSIGTYADCRRQTPLPLAGEAGWGAASAPAGAAGEARQRRPSRREALPQPLPPSGRGARRNAPNMSPASRTLVLAAHQVSMKAYFLPSRGGAGGTRFRLFTIQRRVSAGSITSSSPPPAAALTARARS